MLKATFKAIGALAIGMAMSANAANLIETENLVENGLFLDDNGSYAGNISTEPTGWQFAAGTQTQFIDTTTLANHPFDKEGRYFYGGRSAFNSITQSFDLTSLSEYNESFFRSGAVTIKLDVWMWSGATDDARARVLQKDAAGNYIGDVVNTGFTQINDPYRYTASGMLHEDAVSLHIFLDSDRDYGTANNGYVFDPTMTLLIEDNEANRNLLNIDTSLSLQEAQNVAQAQFTNVPLVGAFGALMVFAGATMRRKK